MRRPVFDFATDATMRFESLGKYHPMRGSKKLLDIRHFSRPSPFTAKAARCCFFLCRPVAIGIETATARIPVIDAGCNHGTSPFLCCPVIPDTRRRHCSDSSQSGFVVKKNLRGTSVRLTLRATRGSFFSSPNIFFVPRFAGVAASSDVSPNTSRVCRAGSSDDRRGEIWKRNFVVTTTKKDIGARLDFTVDATAVRAGPACRFCRRRSASRPRRAPGHKPRERPPLPFRH